MSLYNELRPHDLDEIVGQEKVTQLLAKDFKEHAFKQVYLFTGIRGTGKTTFARMVAEAVNCEHPKENGCGCGKCSSCKGIRSGSSIDVQELDAASNNSVDDIRQLLSAIQYKPVCNKKVYILDECHMLSPAASNALLKKLEEPPKDVMFILCTTELQKVLPTIISRASRYEFEKIESKTIAAYLSKVCTIYKKQADPEALQIIAKAANGGMRDALSILEQFFKEDFISTETVLNTLGLTTSQACFEVLECIAKKDAAGASSAIQSMANKGCSLSYMVEESFRILLDFIEFVSTGDVTSIQAFGSDYMNSLVELAENLTENTAFRIMSNLQQVYYTRAGSMDFAFNAAVIRCVYEDSSLETALEEIKILKKEVEKLNQALSSGQFVSAITKNALADNQPGKYEQNTSEMDSSALENREPKETQPNEMLPFEEEDFDTSEEFIPVTASETVPIGMAQTTVGNDTWSTSSDFTSFDSLLNSMGKEEDADSETANDNTVKGAAPDKDEPDAQGVLDWARQFSWK